MIVPTDFSEIAENAFVYAVRLADKLDAELALIHAFSLEGPPHAAMLKNIDDALEKVSYEYLHDCVEKIKKKVKTKREIPYHAIKGNPFDEVLSDYVKKNDIDLIVMGTKGAGAVKKVLMGSNAASIIRKSEIPVLVVPEEASFSAVKHIVYATDMENMDAEMNLLVPLASLFHAHIHIVHFFPEEAGLLNFNAGEIAGDFAKKYAYPDITFYAEMNESTVDGIEKYIKDKKADLLTLFTHKRSFIEQIYEKSIAREISFHSYIPLLSLKKGA